MAIQISGLGCSSCGSAALPAALPAELPGLGALGLFEPTDAWDKAAETMAHDLIAMMGTADPAKQRVLYAMSRSMTALAHMERARYDSASSREVYPKVLVDFWTSFAKATAGVPANAFKIRVPVAIPTSVDTIPEPYRSQAIDAMTVAYNFGFIDIISNEAFWAQPSIRPPTGVSGLGAAWLVPVVIIVCAVALLGTAWAFASGVESYFHDDNAYSDCVIANQGDTTKCGSPPGASNLMENLKWIVLGVGGFALIFAFLPEIKGLLGAARR